MESSMKPANPRILTVNGGSSSIKFALFKAGDPLRRILKGGIGDAGVRRWHRRECATVRAQDWDGLGFPGIELEEKRNVANAAVISTAASRVAVRVIRTNEELMIAKTVCRVLGLG
jgi:acetate kinase